jgi:hypothetical protein
MNTHTLSRGSYTILITIGKFFLFQEAVDDHRRGKRRQEN